jgi:hypothetical protein
MNKTMTAIIMSLYFCAGVWGATMTLIDLPATNTDAAIDIRSSKTYTHAFDFGSNSPTTINGVALEQGPTDSEFNEAFEATSAQGYGYIIDDTRTSKVLRVHAGNDPSGQADGDSADMLRDMVYFASATVDNGMIVTLSDLNSGQRYSVRSYFRAWEVGNDRLISINADGESHDEFLDSLDVSMDDGGAFYVDYTFISQDTDVTLQFITNGDSQGVHLYGLTCEEATSLPLFSNPYPINGTEDIWLGDNVLTWTGPSNNAGLSPRHRVFLSDSLVDVNDGLISPIESDVNSVVLESPLAYGTTYYWRVDEANSVTGWDAGPIWSFTTESNTYAVDSNNITVTASSYNTTNGNTPEKTIDQSGLNTDDQHSNIDADMWVSSSEATGPAWLQYEFDRVLSLDSVWIWNYNQPLERFVGFGFKDVLIEVSLDGNTWSTWIENTQIDQADGLNHAEVSTIVDLGGVLARFVRITALSNWKDAEIFGLSEVRFYSIPIYARLPEPSDGATDVSLSESLSWRPGRTATTQDIYFSTDSNTLDLIDTTPAATLDLSDQGIEYGRTYYWRVDGIDGDEVYAGDLWSYSTPAYLSLEDFEDYDDDCRIIYWSWQDGAGYEEYQDCGISAFNGNGSSPSCYVGYYNAENGTYGETTMVYSGNQSMPFEYNNTKAPYYSEARSTDGLLASDWTVGGVDTLSLFVQGSPADLVEVAPDNLIVSGAGTDIFGTNDEFRYVYKRLDGDGSIVARVMSLDNSNEWAKAGLMIRSNLGDNARNALVYVSPEHGVRLQQRAALSGDTSSDSETASDEQMAVAAPNWLKIERSGDTINAYYATDETGTNWIAVSGNPQEVPMVESAYIGVAVCSHATDVYTVAEFTDIATTGAVSGDWTAEAVGVEQPVNNPESMYVKVTDSTNQSATVVHENAAATQMGTWTQWDISLNALNGLNLSNIKSLTIGVGDGSSAGGTGLIYVDEIRLTRSGN